MQWITLLLSLLPLALGGMLSPTDTITWGGDVSRAGYQTTHNMDPSVVGSVQFGQLFQTSLPGYYRNVLEQIYAQPLVYTLDDGIQYVFVATTQNNVYKINAKTGTIVSSRNLHIPFLTSDLDACVDINPLIGVTATGTIDPDTDTWYLTAKTYLDQTDQTKGRENARYYFHAIDVNTLEEKPGFPTDLEGTLSRNGDIGNRMFQGGEAHQRPALLLQDQYIYAGFASHCVLYNFTGWIMGWDKGTGALVEAYAMEGGPEPNTVRGGGVWMSGGGIASDGQGSIFFGTGNGYASQLDTIPVPGRQPPSALEEAAVHMKVNDDGTLDVVDFFMPWEKKQLDGADKDLGTTPLELLPTDVFTCPNVKRMGVITGKSGKTYFLNIDDLGGYRNGPNGLDAVPQVTQNENSVYSGAGVYPLEGGYIYISVIGYPTHVFQFSCDNNGDPTFTHVADSPENNAAILGIGHGTVTSLNGQPGTGLVWVSDVEGFNLRIYNAVPSNGKLTLINAFNIAGVTKFTRPVFGDGRAYIGTTQGLLYAFGSPVNLPLNCSSPYRFGTVILGNLSAPTTVQCLATTNVQLTALNLVGNKNFIISGVPQLPLNLNAGDPFSFQAIFSPIQPGPLSSDVVINATAAGFSPLTPISLTGTGESLKPIIGVIPNTLSYEGFIIGQQEGGVNASAIFTNTGDGVLNITSIAYSIVSEGGPTVQPNATASGPQVGPFTFIGLPATIPGQSQVVVTINFNPSTSGNFAVYLTFSSNGGTQIFDVVAASNTSPQALIEFQAADGSDDWIPYSNTSNFTFGSVTEQTTKKLQMRLTNVGGSSAGQLTVTVSKPPFGVPGIIGAENDVDLAEGTELAAGQSATATLYCSVPKSQVNVDSYDGNTQWTINTGDPNLGKVFIQFDCTAVSEQVGPLAANGSALYRYDFCAVENNPGRQLSKQLYSSANNTNEMCITTCAAAGYKYCGTQYTQECWAGNSMPIQSSLERDCNYACTGNVLEICGGNGYFQNRSFISLFVNPALPEGSPNPTGASGNTGNTGVSMNTPTAPTTIRAFSYLGCYTEATDGRALASSVVYNDSMTLEYCAAQMQAYTYFGVEYGRECYGSSQLAQGSVLTTASDCSFTCPGNSAEPCGAGNRLQLYEVPPTPSTVQSLANWTYVGCYTEGTNSRALSGLENPESGSGNTVEVCGAACEGYTYFGVEYAGECYCGNSFAAGSVIAAGGNDTTENGCNMLCPGDLTEYCGGGNRLNVYQVISGSTASSTPLATTSSSSLYASSTPSPTTIPMSSGNYSFIGCYSEATNARALTGANNPSSKSVDNCAAFCASNGATRYFGVEYYGECYCGDTLDPTSAPTTGCTYPCDLNSTQICGGSAVFDLYELTSLLPTLVTLVSSTFSSSIASISGSSTPGSGSSSSVSVSISTVYACGPTSYSTTISVPSTFSTIGAPKSTTPASSTPSWAYLGCYTEGTNSRALTSSSITASNMTVEYCASVMAIYDYFGVEYSDECYGGNVFSTGAMQASASDCSMSCAGNITETCGGPNRLSAYQNTKASPLTIDQGNSNFTYYNCVAEPSSGRALPTLLMAADDVTVESCLFAGSSYEWVGLEYARECWAASTISSGATNATDSRQCSMACSGNSTEVCGDANFLSLYRNKNLASA